MSREVHAAWGSWHPRPPAVERIEREERTAGGVLVEPAEPGVPFYTNKFANLEKTARKRIYGGSGAVGDGYESGSAAFLEFHAPLAAWLHPSTPSAAVRAASAETNIADAGAPDDDDTLLAPGELYHNVVRTDMWFCSPHEGL
ncbi:hypothetical protein CERSUDRAFT_100351 [Gelatoporia subvermispora B]|uniref:Uncharacterized protein n=1 Tax=Ceriporiopsis subvermispora (strain B) TaxID=914234 RepID=M2QHG5_CERS8|nr:hypothetical protein CERSUDRAFT_100351 [Gelatoporia subvermispora B]